MPNLCHTTSTSHTFVLYYLWIVACFLYISFLAVYSIVYPVLSFPVSGWQRLFKTLPASHIISLL